MAAPADAEHDLGGRPQQSRGRARFWFLTVWEAMTGADMDGRCKAQMEEITWYAYQQERCPTSERIHYHVGIKFEREKTFAETKAFLNLYGQPAAVFNKTQRGAIHEWRIYKYCTKEDTRSEGPWTGGELPTEPKQAVPKAEQLVKRMKAGASDQELVEEFAGQARLFSTLRMLLATHRREAPRVIFIWGRPGVGKTRYAVERYGQEGYIILHSPRGRGTFFCNGYSQQKLALFDDAEPPTADNITFWLTVLDRYELNVDVKGAHIAFNSPTIIITSNLPLFDWVSYAPPANQEALVRRIHEQLDEANILEGLQQAGEQAGEQADK